MGSLNSQRASMRGPIIRTLVDWLRLWNYFMIKRCSISLLLHVFSILGKHCKSYFSGMITMMSCWMQILDLRYRKQIYWTVHAVLTHDLGEWKKTSLMRRLGARQRAIHYLSQGWTSSMSLHGVIISQCGLLKPYSEILSTLAQVIACCLTAPIHYLNQYWLFIVISNFNNSSSNNLCHTVIYR